MSLCFEFSLQCMSKSRILSSCDEVNHYASVLVARVVNSWNEIEVMHIDDNDAPQDVIWNDALMEVDEITFVHISINIELFTHRVLVGLGTHNVVLLC